MPSDPLPGASLFQHRDFVRLWIGQTVSIFGSLITRTALPFTAILFLKATPVQVALLSSVDLLAGFLVGLFAGVLVDRLARRPILIATDLGRAAVVLLVPLAALTGVLRMEMLYLVAVLSGTLSTLFDVAYTSYLPTLVHPDELVEGNSKLTATASVAEFLAFGAGGWLVQILSAPFALLIDAGTFLVSALSLLLIRQTEQRPEPAEPSEGDLAASPTLIRDIGEGFRAVARQPELRALALSQWALDFGGRVYGGVFLLYVTRILHTPPGCQGMIYAIGGLTSLVGALLAGRIIGRIGLGRTLILGVLTLLLGQLMVPLAPDFSWLGIALLVLNQILTDPAWTIYEIGQVTLRQTLTEDRTRGRVNATFRVGSLAAMLAGTLLGGYLGERIGLRETLFTGLALTLAAPLITALSPLARRRAI